MSFSLIRNVKAILSTDSPKGAITSLNGMRTLSMTWVILGHMFAFGSMVGKWGNFASLVRKLIAEKHFVEVVEKFRTNCVNLMPSQWRESPKNNLKDCVSFLLIRHSNYSAILSKNTLLQTARLSLISTPHLSEILISAPFEEAPGMVIQREIHTQLE